MQVWRISRHVDLQGLGGTYVSGRWHTRPRPIIYAAESPALALIETLVHMDLTLDTLPTDLQLIRIEIDDDASMRPVGRLPGNWQAIQPASQRIGNQWLMSGASLVLTVPSAIISHVTNMLINPLHAQAAGNVRVIDVEPFWIDPRFIR